MRFQYGFYCLLLFMSCNTKHSEVSATLKPSQDTEFVIEKENKLLECVEQLDAGVEIIAMTEEWAQQMGVMDLYKIDPGFDKWCVFFHDIPDNPPYILLQKRISQDLPDCYYPCEGMSSENILTCKNRKVATSVIVSARGYLPGEKVIIRLSAKDAFREAVFYPRPLLLKKKSGEILAKGELLCAKTGDTLYSLDICGVEKKEKYTFTSYSGNEIIRKELEGPAYIAIIPEVIGMSAGIAKIELLFEEGTCYIMELPWKNELLEYKLGNK